VLKTSFLIFGLCAGVAALAIASIRVADGAVLRLLLGGQVEISSSLLVAMMCMVGCSFPYFVSNSLLSYAGDFAGIILAAFSGAALLLSEILAAYFGGLDLIGFLYGFVFALLLASAVSTFRLARRLCAISQA
jgi:ABC-type multidrug transport system permease subunit